jgi:hypothetical protein
LEKLIEWCGEEIAVRGKNFVFERVDSAQITLGLFGKFILLGYGVMAMTLLVAKGPEIEAVGGQDGHRPRKHSGLCKKTHRILQCVL